MVKITVSCIGDPLSPKTWSGTPANICTNLIALGRLGDTINSARYASDSVKEIVRKFSCFYYLTSHDPDRGRFIRFLRGKKLNTILNDSLSPVLHLGTLDLPLPRIFENRCHFLLCDSTWDLWRQGAATIDRYSSRLLNDAERLEKSSYSQMTHIFAISEYVKDNLVTHYRISADMVSVVGTGRGGIKEYHGEKPYENGTILFIAKERFKDKGGDLLVEGFKIANQTNPALRLIIAGNEENRRYVGDIENIEVKGHIPLEQLQQLFNESALFAMPAVNEPWGLVYLEALSCKTPVLGINQHSLPEITLNGRFGFLVENRSPLAVAEKLLEAFSDLPRLHKMGIEGQEHCLQNFTWEKTVGRIVNVIDSYYGNKLNEYGTFNVT